MTVGSRTYCQASVPHINVCGQHHTIVNEGAQPGNGDGTHNNYVVRCPNYGEGCEWTGELNQLENHLNPQPTTLWKTSWKGVSLKYYASNGNAMK